MKTEAAAELSRNKMAFLWETMNMISLFIWMNVILCETTYFILTAFREVSCVISKVCIRQIARRINWYPRSCSRLWSPLRYTFHGRFLETGADLDQVLPLAATFVIVARAHFLHRSRQVLPPVGGRGTVTGGRKWKVQTIPREQSFHFQRIPQTQCPTLIAVT